jgi:hypothetical protein
VTARDPSSVHACTTIETFLNIFLKKPLKEGENNPVPNSPTTYYDDDELREALRKVNSYRTLHEIYGFFHGCQAASKQASFAQYLPLIYDVEHGDNISAADAEKVRTNLLSLWNFVARWKPIEEPFSFPEHDYPDTAQGLLEHAANGLSLIHYFKKGIEAAKVKEQDYSSRVKEALQRLEFVTTQLHNYAELYEAIEPDAEVKDPKASAQKFQELEDIIGQSIARVISELKRTKH